MKSLKSLIPISVALLIGFALGAYVSRPPKVKASGYFYVHKVTGNSYRLGDDSDYLGFSCTAQDCYILTR